MLRIPTLIFTKNRSFLIVQATRLMAEKPKFPTKLPDMLEKNSKEKLYFIKDQKFPAANNPCSKNVDIKSSDENSLTVPNDKRKTTDEEVIQVYEEYKGFLLAELIAKLRARIWDREKKTSPKNGILENDKDSTTTKIVQISRDYWKELSFLHFYCTQKAFANTYYRKVQRFCVEIANYITIFVQSPEFVLMRATFLMKLAHFLKASEEFLIAVFKFFKECYWDHSYYSSQKKIKRKK